MDNNSEYCKHGTYIGTWWGPDYLCGPCESEGGPIEWSDWEDEDDLQL